MVLSSISNHLDGTPTRHTLYPSPASQRILYYSSTLITCSCEPDLRRCRDLCVSQILDLQRVPRSKSNPFCLQQHSFIKRTIRNQSDILNIWLPNSSCTCQLASDFPNLRRKTFNQGPKTWKASPNFSKCWIFEGLGATRQRQLMLSSHPLQGLKRLLLQSRRPPSICWLQIDCSL